MGQDYKSKKYRAEFYKRNNSVGIRHKTGKQCFSFGGTRCGLGKEVMMGFAGMALKRLDAGTKEEDVETWAKEAVKRDD